MPTIKADALRDFTIALLETGGFAANHAIQTADMLIWANLRGVDSHGVLRVPRYVEMLEQGIIVSRDGPTLVSETGAVAVLDGGKCPGAVGMNAAVAKAAVLARSHGLGWCAARNISHCGALGHFTDTLARDGLIGIAMSASKPLMSYFGAKGEALSTNPLSIAVPSRAGVPMILDMSTAAVALGKIMAARDQGASIPEGWGIDENGKPTTDPNKVKALMPMAGPKGSGLSLMIEVLASVLAGNPLIGPALTQTGNGGFNGLVIAADPAAFGELSAFEAAIAQLETAIHALEPVADEPVLLPGERGAAAEATRREVGVPLAAGTVARLSELAARLAVRVPEALK